MLELHEPDGALDRLEEWLRAQGFFAPGGEALLADLYLGYGLSSAIRRTATLAPPEPCPLPLLACAVRPEPHDVDNDNARDRARAASAVPGELEIGAWRRTWPAARHRAAVDAVRRAIVRGDVYQVNLVQHLSAPFAGSPHALAARLAPLTQPNDAPLGDSAWRVLEGDGWAIVSASPELLVSRGGRSCSTRRRSRASSTSSPPSRARSGPASGWPASSRRSSRAARSRAPRRSRRSI
jgi:hypothetical protein